MSFRALAAGMRGSQDGLVRSAGRGVVGGLLLGMPLLYTMETWWLGGRMEVWHLLGFALGGLLVVFAAVHLVGFRPEHQGPGGLREAAADFTQLLLHAFAAAFGILFLFGIVETDDDPLRVVRMGLMQVVPLGFGAALANHALRAGPEQDTEEDLLREMVVFGAGAAFFSLPAAPTEEMARMAAHAGLWRMPLIAASGILLTHLTLYELRFRGSRTREQRRLYQWGETLSGYVVAFVVCGLLLWGFGQFTGEPPIVALEKTVVLSFLGSLGGAAARVVL